jgi:F-type H+-transporting ATPase subunit alpha
MEMEDQVMVILAGTSGYADHVPVEKMDQWQTELLRFMSNSHPEIGKEIIEKKALSDELRSKMAQAFETFSKTWQG